MKRKTLTVVAGIAAAMSAACLAACADKKPDKPTDIPEHEHAYVESVVDATCTDGGYTLHKCGGCNDSYKTDETSPLGHDYTKSEELNDEAHRLRCSRCDEFKPTDDYAEHVMRPLGTGVKCDDCGFTVGDTDSRLAYELDTAGTGYIVTGYEGSDAVIVIPEKYENKPVVGIKAGALASGQSWIRNLVLPSTLEYIETGALSNFRVNRAFFRGTVEQWCGVALGDEKSNPFYASASGELWIGGELIKDLVVPSGVTEISKFAFAGCAKVESVALPSTLTTVGDKAFYACTGIKTVALPESLTSLSQSAFDGCKIDEITSTGSKYVMKNYCLIETATKTLIRATSAASTVPADGSVQIIGASAFAYIDVESVTIPAGVTEIQANAFDYCQKLRDLTLGANLTTIGDRAFAHCSNLTKVTIPDKVTKLGKEAFGYCYKLTSVTLGKGLTAKSFTNSSFMTGPNNASFAFCTNLFEVYNLTGISMSAGATEKYGDVCKYAKNIYTSTGTASKVKESGGFEFYDGDVPVLLSYTGSKTTLTLPDTLGGKNYSVASHAFYKSDLVSVTVPASVTGIDNYAFGSSDKLETATVMCSVVGTSMFDGCTALKSVELSDSITKIANYMFNNCTSLESIALLDATELGAQAFGGCTALKRVEIPKVTTIGDKAFDGCTALEYLDISGMTSIASRAFYNFASLKTVVLGEGLESIGDYVFCYCNIDNLIIPASCVSVGQMIIGSREIPEQMPNVWCYAVEKPAGFVDWWDYICSTEDDETDFFATVHWGGTWELVDGVPTAK